jgi:hypothetical protein
VYWCAHPCTSRYTSVYWCTHPCTSRYISVYIGVYTRVHRCTQVCTSVYAGVHTCTHLCTPAYTPVHWRVTLVLRQLYTSYACITPINFCKGYLIFLFIHSLMYFIALRAVVSGGVVAFNFSIIETDVCFYIFCSDFLPDHCFHTDLIGTCERMYVM